MKEKVNPLPHPSGITTVIVWLYGMSYKNEIALHTITYLLFQFTLHYGFLSFLLRMCASSLLRAVESTFIWLYRGLSNVSPSDNLVHYKYFSITHKVLINILIL